MAQNIYLDPNTYDFVLTDTKNLRFTENDSEYFSQKIENVLSFFEAEWYLNPVLGIPYYQNILKKQADLGDISNIFFTALTDIPGVVEVLEFEFDFDNSTREYTIDFKVRVDSGEIVVGSI